VGADVEKVAQGMGYDKRIGREFLRAGLGWGGSCLPKDTKAFIKTLTDYGVNADILKGALEINESRVDNLLNKLRRALWVLKGKKIALWGLSFKPDTDDIREAPSLRIIRELLKEEARVRAYDPKAVENVKRIFVEGEDLRYFSDKYEAVKGAEALVVVTEWEEFKKANLKKVKKLMELPIIVDGRNIYEGQGPRL